MPTRNSAATRNYAPTCSTVAPRSASWPTHRGSAKNKDDLEAIQYWWPNRQQAEHACGEAETLAFVYLITQDAKYGQAARKWVLHLASWDPDGPTNFALN